MPELFAAAGILGEPPYAAIVPGAALLRGFALPYVTEVLGSLGDMSAGALFRHMMTPWRAVMSVAMTNCSDAGWLTDRTGYRYDRIASESGRPRRSFRTASRRCRAAPRRMPATRL